MYNNITVEQKMAAAPLSDLFHASLRDRSEAPGMYLCSSQSNSLEPLEQAHVENFDCLTDPLRSSGAAEAMVLRSFELSLF